MGIRRLFPLYTALLIVFSVGRAHAQALPDNPRYAIAQVGADVGLATRLGASLVQDRLGLVGIGTLDGLFRYDGVNVKEFGTKEGLPSPYIDQLIIASDGTLWAVTHEGVAFFDGIAFKQVNTGIEEELSKRPTPVPQRLAVDNQNRVFVASQTGLLQFENPGFKKTKTWTRREGLPGEQITAVHASQNGIIWFGCEGRVGFIDGANDRLSIIPDSAGIPLDEINSILVSKEGVVWVRTKHNLLYRSPGSDNFVRDDEGIPPVTMEWGIPSLDREGMPLIPTINGLYYKLGGRWRNISEKQGLASDMVLSAFEDNAGTLWLGLGGAGINRWPGRKSWEAWTTDNGLPDNVIWKSIRDKRGRLWVATNDGVGIWLPEEGRWVTRGSEEGVVGYRISQIVETDDGWIWTTSSRFGMTRFNPETLEASGVDLPEGCGSERLWASKGPGGRIWLACQGSLHHGTSVEGNINFEKQDVPEPLLDCTRNVMVAPDGVVWTAGAKGLGRFDGKEWQKFDSKDGLKLDFPDELTAISGEEVWFGYHDFAGVTRLTLVNGNPQVMHFGLAQGMPSETVYLVAKDARGNIWAGGNAGLSRISRKDFSIKVFNREDGLIWDDVSGNSFTAEKDGSFFVGTSRGLAHYSPDADEDEPSPPAVVITSVVIGGRERLKEQGQKVDHSNATLWVNFSGLAARRPAAIKFRYRLRGLETDYVETKLREARYPSLPAREYVFEVSCTSADGIPSEGPATFHFVVRPPWWETLWFRGLTVATVFLLIGAFVKLRTRKLERDRHTLEVAVAERSTELALANQELKNLSFTDALTQTRNRRYFSEVVIEDVSRVLRRFEDSEAKIQGNISTVIFMVDIDFFKRVNDDHGHLAGDQVLMEFSNRLKKNARQSDLIVRWGGEEFLVLCRDSNKEDADVQVRRFLEAIGTRPFEIPGDKVVRLTCSLGFASFPWDENDVERVTFEQVIELADRALYQAKQDGRNRAIGLKPLETGLAPEQMDRLLDEPLKNLDGSLLKIVHQHGPGTASEPPKRRTDSLDPE